MTPNDVTSLHRRPIANSYAVPGAALYAGEYPSEKFTAGGRTKLTSVLDAGVTAFVDLTAPADGLTPYAELLQELAAERGVAVAYDRLTITDMGVCDVAHMHRILDLIAVRLAEGHVVYVHCWGGVGRTGTVVGCWLVQHGRTGKEALTEVLALFKTMSAKK